MSLYASRSQDDLFDVFRSKRRSHKTHGPCAGEDKGDPGPAKRETDLMVSGTRRVLTDKDNDIQVESTMEGSLVGQLVCDSVTKSHTGDLVVVVVVNP